MQCVDQDGNVRSSSTGKKMNMVNWVTSQRGENGGGGEGDSCNCEADVAHFLNITASVTTFLSARAQASVQSASRRPTVTKSQSV